ncbi:MAG: magnesium transporter [Phycisphaeraceae bacterium]
MSDEQATLTPWDQVEQIVESGNAEHIEAFLQLLPPGEVAYTISRLDEQHRTRLLAMVDPEIAADLMEHLADEHAADLIEELPAEQAAAIVDEMDSDDQADVLGEMDEDDAAAILEKMDPQEAADARRLSRYAPDTAGGVMVTEYVSYFDHQLVDDVLDDLRRNAKKYAEYDVHYMYVINDLGKLLGVVRLRELVLAPGNAALTSVMKREPVSARVDTPVQELEDVFDHYNFTAVPVVDPQDRLVGVVHHAAVEEAHGEASDKALLRFGGIIAGEEFRTMPAATRSVRRLAFLIPNILLLLISVSVIALFEESTIKRVTALAIFLPLVAGLAGNAGNQAVAVSIRELSLGLVKPIDLTRVLFKEAGVGMINGLVLGLIVLLIAWAWQDDAYLGLVVGGAIPLTIVIAAALGGTIPLMLKGLKIDPAMASGPILTTCVDLFAFLSVLSLAYLMLHKLTGA